MSVQVKGSGTIGGLDEGLVVSGIVTSSTQINVGSNVKIGNAGVVTATSFVGSGANLTGIDATKIITGNTQVQTIDTGSDGHVKVITEGSERLRIGSNGSVGIGTDYLSTNATTYHKLMVVGDTTSTIAVAKIVRKNSSASNSTYTFEVDSSVHGSNMSSGGAMAVDVYGGRAFTIDGNGKVGVGTNNPTAKLEIKGSDNPLVKIVQDTSGIARLNLESATNDGYQYSGIGLGDGTNDAELMWTTGGFDVNVGNAVRLRITSAGKVGINNTAPEGVGIDITSSRTTQYSDTGDQRGLAHLILRNSSDAPDRFCSLSFVNGGGTQAEASINLVQTGNYTGDLRFKFRDGSGSSDWRERFRITSAGQVKMAHQPSFYATANSGGTVSMSSTHTLTNWRLSTSGKTYSIGGHFNTSNGRFTAPIQGTYLFTGSILLSGYDQASSIHMMWRKNGSNYQYWYNTRTSDIDRSGYGGYLAQGSTTTFSLVANDYVDVACTFNGSLSVWAGDANWGHFSAHFLG